ncbi:MAG: hypothetical protein M5R40_14190 [Anaerolineae bacterium]|nr:hypothetical protein [Anaerolineae bacterium]
MRQEYHDEAIEKALTLWFNSTLSIFILLMKRQETRGAWIQFKKPILAALPVLDLRTLSTRQLSMLAASFDRLCNMELRPFPEMALDEVRAEIDETIAQALDLPDFSSLRTMLSREPVVCLERL